MSDESRTIAVAPRRAADASPSARSASSVTNRATSRWNANTTVGRRARDLFKAYFRQLGQPDDAGTQAAILAAAEKVVLAEMAREDCLKGMTAISVELVVRLENLAARSLRSLKLDKPVSTKRAAPTLEDIKARYATPATGETSQ
jgi:hypothetical protein